MMALTLLCLDYKVADLRANVHSVAAFSSTPQKRRASTGSGRWIAGWCGVVSLSLISIIFFGGKAKNQQGKRIKATQKRTREPEHSQHGR